MALASDTTVDLRRERIDEDPTIEVWRMRRRTERGTPAMAPTAPPAARPPIPDVAAMPTSRSGRSRPRRHCMPHLGSPRYAALHDAIATPLIELPASQRDETGETIMMRTLRGWDEPGIPWRAHRRPRSRPLPGRATLLGVAIAIAIASYAGASAWVRGPDARAATEHAGPAGASAADRGTVPHNTSTETSHAAEERRQHP